MNKQDLQNKTGEVWDILFSHLFWYVKDHNNKVELDGYECSQAPSFCPLDNIQCFKYLYIYINDMDELILHCQMTDINNVTTEHDASQELFTLDDLSLFINHIK